MLAFFWGLFLLWKNTKLTSYKEFQILDGAIVVAFGSLFFARLVFYIFNFQLYGTNILKFILINGFPGLSLIGGLVGGFFTLYLFCRFKKIDFIGILDYTISPLFLSLAIGKIGSFLAGVDAGTKTRFILSVKYLGLGGTRHLTALYEAIFFFIGCYIAHKIMYRLRRGGERPGLNFFFFLLYFSLTNLFLDNFKENHLYFLKFSFNIVFCGVVAIFSGGFFIYYYRQVILRIVNAYAKKTFKRGSGKDTE